MKLSVSNIAWPPHSALLAYAKLNEFGFTGLEVAPGLLLPDIENPVEASDIEIGAAMEPARAYGLEAVSIQSILFGYNKAQLFDNGSGLELFLQRMYSVIDFSKRLSAPNIVFGCPKNRNIPDSWSKFRAYEHAMLQFSKLADRAWSVGSVIAIEPNPKAYGTNFLNSMAEVIEFVDLVDHPGVHINLDLGAMLMNYEILLLDEILEKHIKKISHIHVSLPQLVSVKSALGLDNFGQTIIQIQKYNPACFASIEMRAEPDNPIEAIHTACHFLKNLLNGNA